MPVDAELRRERIARLLVGTPSQLEHDRVLARTEQGDVVRQAVHKALPHAVAVRAGAVTGSDSFTITARSTDPALAAATANAYVTAYVAQRRTDTVNDVLAVSQQIQAKITDVQHQIDALGPALPSPPPINGQAQPLPDVDVQRAALLNQQAGYRTQLNQLQLQLANVTAGAELLSPAVVPTAPAWRCPWKLTPFSGSSESVS